MKSEKQGQLRKISIAVILVLLLSMVIINAQNTGEETSTIQETQTTETQENINLQTNNFETTNTETEITDNTTETINLCENINCSISTLICPDNFTATCENSCIQETGTCTFCTPSCAGHEQTTEQNQTEATERNETRIIGNETYTENNETAPITGGIIIGNETEITNETVVGNETNATIPDNSPPTYSNFAVNNTNPKKNEAVEFYVFWQDDFGLDQWIFSWNSSGIWENETYSFVSSYDENTQILTEQGWKYLKDLSYDDEVATLNGKKIEWNKPLKIISLSYDNDIYKIDGEIDLLVTPDHPVYARVDNILSFLLKRIKDFLFGADIEDFKLVSITDAYDLTKNNYHITFLDENLKPVYVSKITKEIYKGKIYDLTVPNHIVLVKRGGKAVWSSNLNVKEAWSNITKIVNSTGIIAYRFYASDLAGNWNETEINTIEVKESNIITNITTEISNQTLLTISTDKKTYIQNETINLFGEILINGTKVDTEINLTIEFNETLIHSALINAINGSYSYSLTANFEKEGDYLVGVFVENLSAETSFYFLKNYSINLDGMICKEFTDNVLFSSGYTHNKKGSTNYETWKIQTNCEDAGGQNCLLYNVNTKSRILYASPYDDFTGEGSVQISEVDNSNCDNPEEKKYSKYIVRDTPKEDGGKWERYCEKTKIQDSKCELENSENYYKESTCYGIKTFASQYSIVDVVEIKYTWCWDDSYGDNYEDVKKGNKI